MMEPGIYDLTSEQYHNDPADQPSLSASICKVLYSSTPLHAWTDHPRLNSNFVREERELFDLGTVAHALMLQGLEEAHVIQATTKEGVQVSDWRTKAAKTERDEARTAGKVPILAHQWARVQAMVESGKKQIAHHKEASEAFTDGKAEQALVWVDHATDGTPVHCRSRVDWLMSSQATIYDYKATGTSINPEFIGKYAIGQGWDIQSTFYLRGLKAITGEDADFYFVAQEDYAPYALAIIGMAPPWIWGGTIKVQKCIDVWAKCITTGEWPAYPDRICYPDLPQWEESKLLEQELKTV